MLIDTHAHLDQEEFDADRAEVIARATAAGVEAIVAIGVTADSSEAVVRLAAEQPPVFAAVGIQPNYCAQAQPSAPQCSPLAPREAVCSRSEQTTLPSDWERVVALVGSPKVVAIGETGLDRYWDYTPFEVQQDYFDRHLRLSQERDLPFIVHTRESDADVLQMLREAQKRGPLAGVMHSFTGSAATAAECVELGLYISFAGMVTFKKSGDLRAVAATVPVDRILVETDSPYLSPHPLRGKRNEPANVVYTARMLAETRGVGFDEFAAQTTANARRLFGLT